jgi:peptidoglycan hydrolase CwlO-like protein
MYISTRVGSVLTDSKSQEALKKTEMKHQEINRKVQATDHSVTNLMGELQHTEAKQTNLNHTMSKNEAEIDRIASRLLENHKMQIERLKRRRFL